MSNDQQSETKVCKHCGATLTKITMVAWVDLSKGAGAPLAGFCSTTIPGFVCLHEPAQEGETPSGIARTSATFNVGGSSE